MNKAKKGTKRTVNNAKKTTTNKPIITSYKGKSTAEKPCDKADKGKGGNSKGKPKKPSLNNKSVANPPRKNTQTNKISNKPIANKKEFPNKFPFWARFKLNKNRTTLVVNEETIINEKTAKQEEFFIHREATHTGKKDYEKIEPNPDKDDKLPMYLKRESKKPKRMFRPHNKNLDMPKELKERYAKNNKK